MKGLTVGLIAAGMLGLAACGTAGTPSAYHTPNGQAVPGPANSIAPPAPVPSPNATYKGACDYTLGQDPVGGSAVATGDIEVTNTGNIGVVVTATITWPQQGYDPLTQAKTGVQVAAGQMVDVQFNQPLSYDQISNLQNWQLGHMGDSGCTYAVSMTSEFGSAQ